MLQATYGGWDLMYVALLNVIHVTSTMSAGEAMVTDRKLSVVLFAATDYNVKVRPRMTKY